MARGVLTRAAHCCKCADSARLSVAVCARRRLARCCSYLALCTELMSDFAALRCMLFVCVRCCQWMGLCRNAQREASKANQDTATTENTNNTDAEVEN